MPMSRMFRVGLPRPPRPSSQTTRLSRSAESAVRTPPASAPLIPPRCRMAARAIALAAATITALLGVRYAGASKAGGVDRVVEERLVWPLGRHHTLIDFLVAVGSPVSITALTALLVAVLVILR